MRKQSSDPVGKNEFATPVHFSQAYGISKKESELDFFDLNLVYDTQVFIDPFLMKKSSVKTERDLFLRFGNFFRKAYDLSTNIDTAREEFKQLKDLLNVHEPKEIGLGYTEYSHDGSGPGQSFATRLLAFFMESSARKFLKETEVYSRRQFNPITLEIFIDNLGPDGLSDISANLIMDYLILYTQRQCKLLGVPLKELPLNTDGFDFDEMEWKGGGYYLLPENPARPGTAVILIPKRFLRSPETDRDGIESAVKGILSADANLGKKFSDFLGKNVKEIDIGDIREIFLKNTSVFKKYLSHLERRRKKPYDFVSDIMRVLAIKSYSKIFPPESVKTKVRDCETLLQTTLDFLNLVKEHFSRTDGWKDAWKGNKPQNEVAIGRIFRAMGYAYFHHLPNVTFEPQVDMGNGAVDFKVIFLSCRIVIELKKLANSASTGDPPIPGYLHGIKRQLPDYAQSSKATYGIYVTGQHYTNVNKPVGHHNDRVLEIEELLPEVEKEIKESIAGFQRLQYINIIMTPRASASKI